MNVALKCEVHKKIFGEDAMKRDGLRGIGWMVVVFSLFGYAVSAGAAPGDITTVAGGNIGDNGPATEAILYLPYGIFADATGDLYIVDRGNYYIRKVDASGTITTVVGNGIFAFSGDGGPATEASLAAPYAAVKDGSGNLYIVDRSNHRIRKVDASGVITTVVGRDAGEGEVRFSGDGGPATDALLNFPSDVFVDASGNLYIVDRSNHRIRKVDTSGVITTVVGRDIGEGEVRFSGDGGPATEALLNLPYGICGDSAGNLYIADTNNNRVRKVDASGVITTVVGSGELGFQGDGGPATDALLARPYRIAVDGADNLYIVDRSNDRIRKVDAVSGIITTVAGSDERGFIGDGGPATEAALSLPWDVSVDGSGNLYIADSSNNRIRKVDAVSGIITTVAGNGERGFNSDWLPATAAQLNRPTGIDLDRNGDLYIADSGNYRIRVVDRWDYMYTVAGNGEPGFAGDEGFPEQASLGVVNDIALDRDGNFYISDAGNHRIRKVEFADYSTPFYQPPTIRTVAGTGEREFNGDGIPATEATINAPWGVTVDRLGQLYIADRLNSRIRKVDGSGMITTVVGTGDVGFEGDGGPATAAKIISPRSMALNAISGDFYFADSSTRRIRRVEAMVPPLVIDLQFQADVTQTYESYLSGQETALAAGITSGGDSEAAQSDRTALILVKLAQIHVEMNHASNRMEAVSEDLEIQWEELEDLVQSEVLDQDTEGAETVLDGLRDLFLGSRYEELKGRVETVLDSLESDADQMELIWNDFQEAAEGHLDIVRVHLDVLKESEGDFSVAFTVTGGDFRGDEVFEVSRGTLNDIDVLENAFRTTLDETEKAADLLRETLEGTGGNNLSAIASLRIALGQMNEGLDTLITALDEEPLKTARRTLTQLDDIRWDLYDMQDLVIEADSVLAGRTYELEGTIVRPVALIENLTDHPEDVLLDFYRSSTPETYTFRGFFPNGLSEDLLDILSADMVLNPTASWEDTDAHMRVLQNAFQARVDADPRDAEANAGLALARIYFLVSDNQQKARDLVDMAREGDIAGIAEQYDVEDFDYQEALDSTRTYMNVARQEWDMVFMVLFKLDEDPDAPFDIGAEDRIVPIPMTGELLGDILDASEEIGALSVDLAETVQDAFNEAEESFELDLDPNLLDFTNAESGLDFARALERSNDRFFWITPKGTERLTDLGDALGDQLETFSEAATSLRELAEAVHERDEDLQLETETVVEYVRDFETRYQEIQEDFETPSMTIDIDGTRVNLSAWFDAPPDSLIQRFIWYLDDDDATDNTLGGLFPEGTGTPPIPPTPPVVTGPVGPIALDLDLTTGDQAKRQTTAPPKPGDTVIIDLAATADAEGVSAFSATLTFDATQLAFKDFAPQDLFTSALPITESGDPGTIILNVAFLGAGSAPRATGTLGQITFTVLEGFSGETQVKLTAGQFARGTDIRSLEIGSGGATVVVGGAADPVSRSDIDGDGQVGFSDFINFAQGFGSRQGDANFSARLDLDDDGQVGFSDFLVFAQNFGKKVGG